MLGMEKVAIFLRQSEAVNRFRDVILRCFERKEFDQLYVCSGFFQERGKFSASGSIAESAPTWPCLKKVTVIGVYSGMWKPDFDEFVDRLEKIKCPCGKSLIVEKRRTKRYHWHAKVFIACENGNPALGIVGSSNMTRNAFGVSTPWNYEADVVLWDASSKAANAVMVGILENVTNDFPQSIMVTTYNAEEQHNGNLSLRDRLEFLLGEINEQSDIVE